MLFSGILGFKCLLDIGRDVCGEGKLERFGGEGALLDVFEIILGEESVDVLVVVDVINHLGGCPLVGFGSQVGFHLCGGKKEVRPWGDRRFAGGPKLSAGIGHVREVVAVVGGPNGGKHGEELASGFEGGVHFLQSQAKGVDVLEAGNGKDAVETIFHALREVFNQAFKQGMWTQFGKGLHVLNAA